MYSNHQNPQIATENDAFDEKERLLYALQFTGRLLLRQEIPLNDDIFEKLLHEQSFTPELSIKKTYSGAQCQRCGNQMRHLFAEMPCLQCNKNCLYCRKCIEMGRILSCQPLYTWTGPDPQWPKHGNALTWEGSLTSAQQHAADKLVETLHSKNDMLVWAVCGAGKTEMLFSCIDTALAGGQRVCIATPRADVVRELLPRMQRAFATVEIQALYGGSETKVPTAQFVIATTHQLLRFERAFDLMVIDEIDAFPFHKDPSLPYAAKRAVKKSHATIYLTATPRQIHKKQMKQNKLPHVFVPKRFHGHPLPVPENCICFDLQKRLKQFLLPRKMMHWLKNRDNPRRQLLIFVPTIRLAENICKHMLDDWQTFGAKSNLQIASVHSEDAHRKELIQQFRTRRIDVLITTTILERGVTFPSVDVAVLDAGHDVFDEAALVQIAGRAGRSPDDPNGEVVFFHEGKKRAMVEATQEIIAMNKRGGF